MAYASEQDMIERYGESALIVASDRDGDGLSDEGVVERTLADASDLIDSYLMVRYDLPLSQVPGTLTRCCVDIALYLMSADATVATEEQRQRYEDCLKFLKLLAEGKATLGLGTPPADDPKAGSASFQAADRKFSRDTLRGF